MIDEPAQHRHKRHGASRILLRPRFFHIRLTTTATGIIMLRSLASVAIVTLSLATCASADLQDSSLVGTWTTKAGTVLTGPDFYDPVTEDIKEPKHPGSSFSFTSDGHFEEAIYLAIANPSKPDCPKAIIQWQHGTYKINDNGSLSLDPIKVDGRQLYSDPCANDHSIYTRYNQTEYYKSYAISTDGYIGKERLDLLKYDGTPYNPMYIAYRPPQMLPTQTLNPTTSSGQTTATGSSKERRALLKRSLGGNLKKPEDINPDRWFWFGIILTGLGAVGYFCV